MYLIPICAPILIEGERRLVTTDWKRSLELLRDSLEGRYGPLCVLAPSLPADRFEGSTALEELDVERDGIELVPSIAADIRARAYWLRERATWREQAAGLVSRAHVVHGGADNLFKPVMTTAWRLAAEWGVPTVFVQDTDIVLQERELAGDDRLRRLRAAIYGSLYERVVRDGVSRATLSLLKGRDLVQRYGPFGRNVREFHDTSHLSEHVVGEAVLERRREHAGSGAPLRFVYCGRFVERKGLHTAIELVAAAVRAGAAVTYDLVGDGPERARLEALVAERGLGEHVRFLGTAVYGPELIARLGAYDGLLFTPSAEDTPRMIFDGYAAGLPLVATDIAYARERADAEGATVLLPRSDAARGAQILAELAADRSRLLALGAAARAAGEYHAADAWYARRARWTFEAVDAAGRAAA
ncbi:2-deoxystreptamine glucosyltransferase [Planctomycetes bacterium Pla163]|uniref:2-deoxystreptamine glucosyltransferase n=1 Tax=Rohdeia mirabilis TaxID=2528008 RepID=A0A518CXE9_9BACT|nr:2-deoxystreptamine glucosyltransferase [Planctomycetes bacterium Pla163]